MLLRRNAAQGGLPVKKLRESWSGVTNAIEELEREGRVLVTRSGKNLHAPNSGGATEGQMKTVFLDDIGRERDPLDQGQSLPRGSRSPCSLLLGATLVPTIVLSGYHPVASTLEEEESCSSLTHFYPRRRAALNPPRIQRLVALAQDSDRRRTRTRTTSR